MSVVAIPLTKYNGVFGTNFYSNPNLNLPHSKAPRRTTASPPLNCTSLTSSFSSFSLIKLNALANPYSPSKKWNKIFPLTK